MGSAGDRGGNRRQSRYSLSRLSELRETHEWMFARVIGEARPATVIANDATLSQSIDWYAEGRARDVVVAGVRVPA